MKKHTKKLTEKQRRILLLKEDLKECRQRQKRCEMLFELTTDENLIEARIYEMKSLAKHRDYLMSQLREMMSSENTQRQNTVTGGILRQFSAG